MRIAHIRAEDRKIQRLDQHCDNVRRLCKENGARLGLENISQLIGLLHDFGKATQQFSDYLMQENGMLFSETQVSHQNHSPSGSIFAYERWFEGPYYEDKRIQRLTAQTISLCILGHHSGLTDCLNIQGDSPYLTAIHQERKPLNYDEAKECYLKEVCDSKELDELFVLACQDIQSFCREASAFDCGLTVRLLLSILVDADRWDSACFEYGVDPFAQKLPAPDWELQRKKLEQYLQRKFTADSYLQRIRAEISDMCAKKAKLAPGIYSLSVPTGGGKTFSSLRFALTHAAHTGQRRIFYIIPFNTILDQNAQDIREALAETPCSILEHHSNVVLESERTHADAEDFRAELEEYKHLTERWDSDIILTSLIQFLNTVFRGQNSAVRRMHRLTNTILIFDEIQSLPQKCKALFEQTIQFLANRCNCTILLCTATQPQLNLSKTELMSEMAHLYENLKRVHYLPDIRNLRSYKDAAADMKEMLCNRKSVLSIVNTKAAAWEIYDQMQKLLKEEGYTCIDLPIGLSDDELRERADGIKEGEILCVHLSTLMCPAHRLECIRQIRLWTKKKKLTFCVSTALVEAGINISFPVVVRSLAGLPSIIQAAGRCNRNMEVDRGEVHIWRLYEENLNNLPEIKQGQNISKKIIRKQRQSDMLGSQEAMEQYFGEGKKQQEVYPYKSWNTTLNEMLSENKKCEMEARNRAHPPLSYLCHEEGYRLIQSFHTAGETFEVIEQKTKPVLVPYGEGTRIIIALSGEHTMEEEIRLLREAQRYTVNLYDNVYRRLTDEKAIYPVGKVGVMALKDGYYNKAGGVSIEKQEMEEIIF